MIVIVDYGVGNLGSIANMLKKVGAIAKVSSDAEILEQADKLILPGVGAFDHGMKNLVESGLIPLLNTLVLEKRVPVIGLCMGMQLLTKKSEEGELPGLGGLDAETVRFRTDETNASLKVPHMGWNTIETRRQHPLFTELETEARFYFVHSYYVVCHDPALVLAQTDYGHPFASIIGKDNIMGVQFHPEKSHKYGMRLLKNFAECV
jgi:glutamine amidotransferase